MNEQEIKIIYDKSPPPPGQEGKDSGKNFVEYWNSQEVGKPAGETGGSGAVQTGESEREPMIAYKEDGPDRFYIHPWPVGDEKSIAYSETPVPGVEITAEDLPAHMFSKIERAFEKQEYSEIADYILWEIEGGDVISEEVLPMIRDFCVRAKEVKSKEEGTQLLGEIKDFLKRWK